MPKQFDPTADHARSFTVRAAGADIEKREIVGIGVPLETEIEVWPGFREVFDANCQFDNIERAKLMAQHRELIGVISASETTATELNVTGRASKTRSGDEALELAKDGALDSFSIGFRSKEYTKTEHDDGSFTIRHTRVHVREFSLTDNPAYPTATVAEVRERTEVEPLGAPIMTLTREELDTTLEQRFEDQTRSIEARLAAFAEQSKTPTVDTRSAGQVLWEIADGNEATLREYNDLMERAYAGGTSADSPIKDGWVGDLTRIFDSSTGVLSAVFSTGTLPDKGMNIEYAELLANTTKVEKQTAEGADLSTGKVTLTTKTAPVHTYGGYVELTRQQIQRSSLPILDRSLEAMTLAAGARKKAVLRDAYTTLVAARAAIAGDAGVVTLGATFAAGTAAQWTDLIIEAAIRFESLNLPLEAMVVSPAVFKKLSTLTEANNRVFKVASERGVIGTLNLTGLRGDFDGLTVACDTGRTGNAAEFVNGKALRQYDSALAQLQDENIINLSKAFSVYRYGAVAAEIPAAVVPVKIATS